LPREKAQEVHKTNKSTHRAGGVGHLWERPFRRKQSISRKKSGSGIFEGRADGNTYINSEYGEWFRKREKIKNSRRGKRRSTLDLSKVYLTRKN